MKRIAIDLGATSLSDKELAIAQQVLRRNGTLYASKPKNASGDAKYVWRMVVFAVSDNEQHQCMPVMAEFDLDERYFGQDTYDLRREHLNYLDGIANAMISTVPVLQRSGVLRWATALAGA